MISQRSDKATLLFDIIKFNNLHDLFYKSKSGACILKQTKTGKNPEKIK